MRRYLIAGAVGAALLTLAEFAFAVERGAASFYGGKHHGRPMANGEIFDQWSDSCAHKHHSFGTKLRVTWQSRSVACVVRDRGPFIPGRIVDLSRGGARELGSEGRGVVPVIVEVVR